MSTRLSGATKDMINKSYNTKICDLESKCRKLEEKEANDAKINIKNLKEFDDVIESISKLQERVETIYPDFYWYSTFRDLFRYNGDNKDFGYLDKDAIQANLLDNKEYCKIKEEIDSLKKEKNSLLFKLENAPIRSKDYEEAYYKVKEILNQE